MTSNDSLYILDAQNTRLSRWRLRETHYEHSFHVSRKSLGIYVDAKRDVYVAECDGHRISQWRSERVVAGTGRNEHAFNQLNYPSAVAVGRDGNMFVADIYKHRTMRWHFNAPQGTCIVGCSAVRGKKSDQLAEPRDVTFDQEGNLLVADTGNHRIQRFDLFINTSCGKYPALSLNWICDSLLQRDAFF
jgi:sugar lactone lactonase YvrE